MNEIFPKNFHDIEASTKQCNEELETICYIWQRSSIMGIVYKHRQAEVLMAFCYSSLKCVEGVSIIETKLMNNSLSLHSPRVTNFMDDSSYKEASLELRNTFVMEIFHPAEWNGTRKCLLLCFSSLGNMSYKVCVVKLKNNPLDEDVVGPLL